MANPWNILFIFTISKTLETQNSSYSNVVKNVQIWVFYSQDTLHSFYKFGPHNMYYDTCMITKEPLQNSWSKSIKCTWHPVLRNATHWHPGGPGVMSRLLLALPTPASTTFRIFPLHFCICCCTQQRSGIFTFLCHLQKFKAPRTKCRREWKLFHCHRTILRQQSSQIKPWTLALI